MNEKNDMNSMGEILFKEKEYILGKFSCLVLLSHTPSVGDFFPILAGIPLVRPSWLSQEQTTTNSSDHLKHVYDGTVKICILLSLNEFLSLKKY